MLRKDKNVKVAMAVNEEKGKQKNRREKEVKKHLKSFQNNRWQAEGMAQTMDKTITKEKKQGIWKIGLTRSLINTSKEKKKRKATGVKI